MESICSSSNNCGFFTDSHWLDHTLFIFLDAGCKLVFFDIITAFNKKFEQNQLKSIQKSLFATHFFRFFMPLFRATSLEQWTLKVGPTAHLHILRRAQQ